MIRELDTVVLTHDFKEYGLTVGDIGAVVHCYKDSNTYEVEFVTADGKTIAILTLSANDIRLMKEREITCKGNNTGSIVKTTFLKEWCRED